MIYKIITPSKLDEEEDLLAGRALFSSFAFSLAARFLTTASVKKIIILTLLQEQR